jgi:hypothetical protein
LRDIVEKYPEVLLLLFRHRLITLLGIDREIVSPRERSSSLTPE